MKVKLISCMCPHQSIHLNTLRNKLNEKKKEIWRLMMIETAIADQIKKHTQDHNKKKKKKRNN